LKVITLDKGSKKKLQRIRWTRSEIASAVLLTFILSVACIWAAFWYASHYSDEPQTPSLEIKH
jgi:hypothetical protein